MSKADEMFKNLGYKLIKVKRNSIVYKNQYLENIEFDLDNKRTICETDLGNSLPISIQELQAINEKVRELGWN
ncbi:MAG: hypothetical protein HFJ30_00320 [Clostridia bacterium]|jgi:hypothetical protein|nr:hypothetical protein [Clostridia bacterium]